MEAGAAGRACEPFVVMAKPVGPVCNLNCSYCYYLETQNFYEALHTFKMTDAVLENYIRQYIQSSPGPVVQFTWHGGEPTLAGLDFFKRAVKLQQRYLPEGRSCWNNLQTNGILLDDEWCAFLKAHDFDVGVSLDGTQWLHDECRRDHGGNGSYRRAADAVRRLQQHGIQPDLLCTVTSAIAKQPVAVYQALREFDTGWIQFIPIVRRAPEGPVKPDSVTGAEYGSFLCAVFDEWIANDLGRLDVQQFAEVLLALSGGEPNVCHLAPVCGRVLIVEHDGSVYSCDHFVTPEHRIGDIHASSLLELVESQAQLKFGSRKRDGLTSQCRSCRWLKLCNGGCPKDRIAVSEHGEPGHNWLCEGFRQFYARAEQPLLRVLALKEKGLSPEAIMEHFRAVSQGKWKGVGRNDPCPCGSGRKAKQCCWSRLLY